MRDAEKNRANCSLLHYNTREITFSFLEGHENLEESFKKEEKIRYEFEFHSTCTTRSLKIPERMSDHPALIASVIR